jgi:hypothetical protein
MSTDTEVDFLTIHGSTVVCFESHLIAGHNLPPSRFLFAIMNFLGCELVHFNPNTITAFNCFSMSCDCWLGIPPNTSLFWYFYSPTRYNIPQILVYSGIFIPQPDTTRWFILGSGYLFVATAARNTSMLPSRALGGVLC